MKAFGVQVESPDLHWWEKLYVLFKALQFKKRLAQLTDEQLTRLSEDVTKELGPNSTFRVVREKADEPDEYRFSEFEEPYEDEYFKLKEPPK